jgi:hypothetical protein
MSGLARPDGAAATRQIADECAGLADTADDTFAGRCPESGSSELWAQRNAVLMAAEHGEIQLPPTSVMVPMKPCGWRVRYMGTRLHPADVTTAR